MPVARVAERCEAGREREGERGLHPTMRFGGFDGFHPDIRGRLNGAGPRAGYAARMNRCSDIGRMGIVL
jgi:hypothetical protein